MRSATCPDTTRRNNGAVTAQKRVGNDYRPLQALSDAPAGQNLYVSPTAKSQVLSPLLAA